MDNPFRRRIQAAFGPFSQFQDYDEVSDVRLSRTQSRDVEDSDLQSSTSNQPLFVDSHMMSATIQNQELYEIKSQNPNQNSLSVENGNHKRSSLSEVTDQKPKHHHHRSDHDRHRDERKRKHSQSPECTKPEKKSISTKCKTKLLLDNCDEKYPKHVFNLMQLLDDELDSNLRPPDPISKSMIEKFDVKKCVEHKSKKKHISDQSKDVLKNEGKSKNDVGAYVDSVTVPLSDLPNNLKEELVEKKSHNTLMKNSDLQTPKHIPRSDSLSKNRRPAKSVISFRGLIPHSAELGKSNMSPGTSPATSLIERPSSASSMKSDQSVESHRSLPTISTNLKNLKIQQKSDKNKDKKAAQLKRASPTISPALESVKSPLAKPTSPLARPSIPLEPEQSGEKEKSPFVARISKDDKARSSDSRENSKPPIGKVEPMLQHMLVHHNNEVAPTRATNIDDSYRHLRTPDELVEEAKNVLTAHKSRNPVLAVLNTLLGALLYIGAAQRLDADLQPDNNKQVLDIIKKLDKAKRLMKDTVRQDLTAKEREHPPCEPYTKRLTVLLMRAQAVIANAINSLNKQEAWKNVAKIQKLQKNQLNTQEQQEYLKVLKRQADLMHEHLDAGRLWEDGCGVAQLRKVEEEFFAYLEKLVGAPMRIDNNLTQLSAFLSTGIEWIKNELALHQTATSPKSTLLPPSTKPSQQSMTTRH